MIQTFIINVCNVRPNSACHSKLCNSKWPQTFIMNVCNVRPNNACHSTLCNSKWPKTFIMSVYNVKQQAEEGVTKKETMKMRMCQNDINPLNVMVSKIRVTSPFS